MRRFYLDTSIWLDLLEDRNHYIPTRGEQAKDLLRWILINQHMIVISDTVFAELTRAGYQDAELDNLFRQFSFLIEWWEVDRLRGQAKVIAARRDVPHSDVIHALCARESRSTVVSRDKHFLQLTDICKTASPDKIIANPTL